MADKNVNECGCLPTNQSMGCCRVEAVISVDERGQMVLPKEIRDKAGIGAGDKLAVIDWEKDGKICCILLIKAEEFGGMIKDILGPMMAELGKKEATK